MTSFKDSQEAAFRRLVRGAIRKSEMTKSERDVTLAFVNHWLHHRNGKKAFVHPGREQIAKKAKVTVKTVSRTLAMLRAAGVLVPLKHLNGGKGKATEYRVNISALMVLCGCTWVDDFLRHHGLENVPVYASKMSRYVRDKMSHRLTDVGSVVSQNDKSGGAR